MFLKLENLTGIVDSRRQARIRECVFALMASITMVLSACGGDGGSSSKSLAGGGIGGTGEGTITGYGSVIINDIRSFGISSSTRITVDGEPASEQDLQTLGTGLVAKVDVADDVSNDFTSGTAVEISVKHQVKGPVTAVTPQLEVLGQTVILTGDSVLANLPTTLAVGDIVEVSGFSSAANVIQATRLEYKAGGTPVWKLTGPVGNLVAGTSFTIGSQTVNFSGIAPRDCGAGLADGSLVKVKAAETAGFSAGDALTNVTGIECFQPGLEIPDGVAGNQLEAEVEGLVESVSPPSFIVNGQQVTTTNGTEYEDGDFEDIVVGTKLEAEGSLNVSTGVLTADKIRFRTARVRIEGPVGIIVAGQSLDVLGIPVLVTPLTDDDGTVASATGNVQVEVRGFSDSAGQVYASQVRDRGTPDNTAVRLRGRITAVPVDPVFQILGVKIDTTNAAAFFDLDGQPISKTQFFAAIAEGMQAEVEGGNFDGVDTITNASTISIED